MWRGIVSVLLALVVAAIQLVFVTVMTGCDLGDGGSQVVDARVVDATLPSFETGVGPDAREADASPFDARLPLCGFGAAPRLTMDSVTYPVTVSAESQALGCCDGVKLIFRHDRPGVSGEEFNIELTLLAEGGWDPLPHQYDLSADNNMLRKTLQWKCIGASCVPNDTTVRRSFTGEVHIERTSGGGLQGTLCGHLNDVDRVHAVFDSIDMYAVDVPFR